MSTIALVDAQKAKAFYDELAAQLFELLRNVNVLEVPMRIEIYAGHSLVTRIPIALENQEFLNGILQSMADHFFDTASAYHSKIHSIISPYENEKINKIA